MRIEKKVPMPMPTMAKIGKNQRAALMLEIGDSVFFEQESQAYNFQTSMRSLGLKGVCRKSSEGYRVWRCES